MEADAIASSLRDFLAESPAAVVVEGGEVIFDFATAKYACATEHSKCLLHLWSDERNTVRRILDVEVAEIDAAVQAKLRVVPPLTVVPPAYPRFLISSLLPEEGVLFSVTETRG